MPTTEGYNGAYTGQEIDAGIAKANSAVQPDGSVAMTGALNMGGQKVTNVGAPSAATDAVRQQDLAAVSDEVDHILDGTTPVYIPPATTAKIGGVIVGGGLSVAESGDLSVNADASPTQSSTNPVQSGGVYNALQGYIPTTQKGAASGVAQLDENGLVPAAQLPGFVDDIVDAYVVGSTPYAQDWLSLTSGGTALTPDASKIYLVVSAGDYQNQQFRWSGTQYGQVSPSIALGETANTAYYGDKGKTAYDHSQITSGNPHGTTAAQVGAITAPSGGTEGQVLTKTTEGTAWEDAPSGLPSGGTPGQLLSKTESGAEWGDKPVMYVHVTESDGNYSADKTFEEIQQAVTDGRPVFAGSVETGGIIIFPLAGISEEGENKAAVFQVTNVQGSTGYIIMNTGDILHVTGIFSARNIQFTRGQTGLTADNVQDAIEEVNAKIPAKPKSVSVTLAASGWSSNVQTVTVSGVKATGQNVRLSPVTKADADAWASAGCWCTAQGANSLTFTCETVPTQDIQLNVEMQEVQS